MGSLVQQEASVSKERALSVQLVHTSLEPVLKRASSVLQVTNVPKELPLQLFVPSTITALLAHPQENYVLMVLRIVRKDWKAAVSVSPVPWDFIVRMEDRSKLAVRLAFSVRVELL